MTAKMLVSVGNSFGEWTVIAATDRTNTIGRRYWLCRCVCGTERQVVESNLVSGLSKSCGHRVDKSGLTGRRYGRWEVIGPAGTQGYKKLWQCRCECGTERGILQSDLKMGKSRSCGCLAAEVTATRNQTHGMSDSKEYKSYNHMIRRCTDTGSPKYHLYGGRGITVCQRWLDSFQVFLDDMGLTPSAEHSIDRIDVNGNYEPGNCRWATPKQQSRNTRFNRLLTHRGKTMTLIEWAEETGLNPKLIRQRIDKRGWTIAEALDLPADLANAAIRRKRS